ncbi:MAG: chromosome segregation protein SMC, partial [Chitinophagaceae bacterium]
IFVVKTEYRAALESVLDQYLNYYVVENIEEAAQAIRLLESNKKGKANFILLDKIPAESQTVSSKTKGGIAALDLVEVEEKYQRLAEHFLGNVLVFEHLEEGTHSDSGEILVDKKGRYKSEPLTVGGGSVGLFEGNKIGRAKNLERLEEEIAVLAKISGELRAEISATQSLLAGFNAELADKSIENTKQEINRLQNSISNFGNRIETYESANASADKRRDDLQHQVAQLQESIATTRIELKAVNEEMDALAEEVHGAESIFSEAQIRFNNANDQYNAQNIQYTRQQSKLESLKGELSFRSNQLLETKRQLEQAQEAQSTASSGIKETEKLLHSGDEELYQLLQKKETDDKILNEKDRSYYELRNAVSAAESGLSQKRKEKDQSDSLLNSIREKLSEMKLQLAGMKERLSVEFKVSLETILEEDRTTELSLEELTAESERMKKRLDNLGEVNPTAIEAFGEVKTRHDFIVEQKTDLVNAKESLLATIEEVETTANNRFRETFDAVRKNFSEVFKALFTSEDSADLRLTDPDNIAESGIEIYAQPKGKKPSTLTQLSGGEKTLTSTAFLFAIYLIKPAPFCILDEVDAPLDDANVGKFTNMIRQFSDNSQFIIVTHNKQTMAAVDVIYGVTMQEPGVSKLVPVDFRSLN